MSPLRITLPWPPSVNHMYQHHAGGRVTLNPSVRAYRAQVGVLVTQARNRGQLPQGPIDTPIHLMIRVSEPDARRRDLDNLRKVLLDALTICKVWRDDSLIRSDAGTFTDTRIGCIEVEIRPHQTELCPMCGKANDEHQPLR